jgi:hypothetical protein
MKNIHILPTDKPSRLWYSGNSKEIRFYKYPVTFQTFERSPQNIYITSDEEIKEGVDQWYLDKVLNEPYNSGGAQYSSKQDVIILTTDQDLIKDGVQAIDDEFLEWFVNYPSCEFVEITTYGNYLSLHHSDSFHSVYKIIIPKEEPDYTALLQPVGTIQETLEEVAHKMLDDYGIKSMGQSIGVLEVKKLMVKMAKWQQEKSYSEEDIREAFRQGQDNMDYSDTYGWDSKLTEQEWFEQFKNK